MNGIVGLYLSYHLGVAGGGTIVLVTTAVFFLVLCVAPQHGALTRMLTGRLGSPARTAELGEPASGP